jgi:hypothetical protein
MSSFASDFSPREIALIAEKDRNWPLLSSRAAPV